MPRDPSIDKQLKQNTKRSKEAHLEVELQRKLAMSLSAAGRLKKECIRVWSEMAHGMAVNNQKAPRRGTRVKTSRYGYNQEKNQDSNPNLNVFC